MFERIEELKLSEKYSFLVTAQSNGTHFAGELTLNSEKCTLIVRGDVLEGRNGDFSFDNQEEFICHCLQPMGTFILLGVKPMNAMKRMLQTNPVSVWHFEFKFEAKDVIFSQSSPNLKISVGAIEIGSNSIARWVGQTWTQDRIVHSHQNNILFDPKPTAVPLEEFSQSLGELGQLKIAYSPSAHYGGEDFTTGLRYPPILVLTFNELLEPAEAVGHLRKLERIFEFLTGRPLDTHSIRFHDGQWSRRRMSFYTSREPHTQSNRDYHFFPLSMNLRGPNQLGLPPFPLSSFDEYFRLPPEEQRYFEKYLIYRGRTSAEEQFLGYFRLLEKLCLQKDYFLDENKLNALLIKAKSYLVRYFGDEKNVKRVLKKLPGINSSKLNTSSCIQKFIKTLPKGLTDEWRYTLRDIDGICDVRNNLTHANEFEPEEWEMERKSKFIEVLLAMKLLEKIGVAVEVSAVVARRLNDYDLIRWPPEPVVYTNEGAAQQSL